MSDRTPQPPNVSAARGGFTLIELLVVMTIIVLMTAAAIPAIRFIVGSRSTETATNVVSAYIGRVRAEAIQTQRTHGVFFFLDPSSDQTTMAMVEGAANDDLKQYAAWTTNAALEYRLKTSGLPQVAVAPRFQYVTSGTVGGPSTVERLVGRASLVGAENGGGAPFISQQKFLQEYACSRTNTPSAANGPPNGAFWKLSGDRFIDLVDGTDFQVLPRGVGLQVLNDTKNLGANADRYLRTSCILFDSYGQFQSVSWAVDSTSDLGQRLQLTASLDLPIGTGGNLFSGFGLVLYDRELLRNSVANSTEGDFIFRTMLTNPTAPTTWNQESTEETWLDNNTLPLVINRQNGTLIKGE